MVDQYLTLATQEQLRAGVTPKRVTLILHPDIQYLMRHMHTYLLSAAQPVDRLAYTRDMALFTVAFRSSSHGSDLAKLLAAQFLRLPFSRGRVSIKRLLYQDTMRWGRARFLPGAW